MFFACILKRLDEIVFHGQLVNWTRYYEYMIQLHLIPYYLMFSIHNTSLALDDDNE